jgi:hypothetical protein
VVAEFPEMLSLLAAPSAAPQPPELKTGEATANKPAAIPKIAEHAFIATYG